MGSADTELKCLQVSCLVSLIEERKGLIESERQRYVSVESRVKQSYNCKRGAEAPHQIRY